MNVEIYNGKSIFYASFAFIFVLIKCVCVCNRIGCRIEWKTKDKYVIGEMI